MYRLGLLAISTWPLIRGVLYGRMTSETEWTKSSTGMEIAESAYVQVWVNTYSDVKRIGLVQAAQEDFENYGSGSGIFRVQKLPNMISPYIFGQSAFT